MIMAHYIDKDALVAEIAKMLQEEYRCDNSEQTTGYHCALYELQYFLNTLEVKEVDDELQGIEKEVAEDGVNAIDRKRTPIVLKGEIKAKFKNEFNTLWQTIHGIQFANVAKHIIERLCLHFAAWGVYNLKDYCSINSEEKHKMDIEVKEVDLEKEYKDFVEEDPVYNKLVNGIVGKAIAKHFFVLGLKAQKEIDYEN